MYSACVRKVGTVPGRASLFPLEIRSLPFLLGDSRNAISITRRPEREARRRRRTWRRPTGPRSRKLFASRTASETTSGIGQLAELYPRARERIAISIQCKALREFSIHAAACINNETRHRVCNTRKRDGGQVSSRLFPSKFPEHSSNEFTLHARTPASFVRPPIVIGRVNEASGA